MPARRRRTAVAVRVELRPEEASWNPARCEPADPWLSLSVTDDGPGIAPEMVERVFAPFFTSKKKQNNAGLGLTVALGYVQQLGGVIRVTSCPRENDIPTASCRAALRKAPPRRV